MILHQKQLILKVISITSLRKYIPLNIFITFFIIKKMGLYVV